MANITGTVVGLNVNINNTQSFSMVVEFDVVPLSLYNKDNESALGKTYVSFPNVILSETNPTIIYNGVEYSALQFGSYPRINSNITFSEVT